MKASPTLMPSCTSTSTSVNDPASGMAHNVRQLPVDMFPHRGIDNTRTVCCDGRQRAGTADRATTYR